MKTYKPLQLWYLVIYLKNSNTNSTMLTCDVVACLLLFVYLKLCHDKSIYIVVTNRLAVDLEMLLRLLLICLYIDFNLLLTSGLAVDNLELLPSTV